MEQQLPLGGALHAAAGVHDENVIRELGDYAKIMGDDDDGVPHLIFDLCQRLNDLRLDGDAQTGGGLVCNEQVGLEDHGHGDENSLPEARGELAGEASHHVLPIVDAHQLEGVAALLLALLPGRVPAMDLVGLDHLLPDGHIGIEGGGRVLKDEGDLGASDLRHLLLAQLQQVLPLEKDLAALHPAGGVHNAHDGAGGHAFAGAALSDNAQHAALAQRKIHAVHRLDDPVLPDMEVGPDALHLQQDFALLRSGGRRCLLYGFHPFTSPICWNPYSFEDRRRSASGLRR